MNRISAFAVKDSRKCIKLTFTKRIMHKLSEGMYKNNFKFEEEHTVASLLSKSMNSRLTKMLEKASKAKEEGSSLDPKYMLKKLLQDIDNLEKFYGDKEYRRRLVSSSVADGYYFSSYSSDNGI